MATAERRVAEGASFDLIGGLRLDDGFNALRRALLSLAMVPYLLRAASKSFLSFLVTVGIVTIRLYFLQKYSFLIIRSVSVFAWIEDVQI